jgi:hypothetical protein
VIMNILSFFKSIRFELGNILLHEYYNGSVDIKWGTRHLCIFP